MKAVNHALLEQVKRQKKKINLVGSKQTLLILLPSTSNTGGLCLSAALSPLSSLATSKFSCAALLGPQLLFGPSVQLQWQSRTVKLHKAHLYYLCGKMNSYNLETAGLSLPKLQLLASRAPSSACLIDGGPEVIQLDCSEPTGQ